jgi:hypothetical protein
VITLIQYFKPVIWTISVVLLTYIAFEIVSFLAYLSI